jgi:chromosome segregation ATPase
MTMSPVDLERKVRQLDNDVQSIYELLNKISTTQQRQGNRITELTELVAGHDARFDAVDARFDRIEASLDTRFDAVETRFDRIEASLDTVLELLRSGRPSTD